MAGRRACVCVCVYVQVWMLTITFFECLNVAAQTLWAAYLGAGNRQAAMAVLTRILQLGCTVGAVVGVIVFAGQDPFVRFFTKDPLVISQVRQCVTHTPTYTDTNMHTLLIVCSILLAYMCNVLRANGVAEPWPLRIISIPHYAMAPQLRWHALTPFSSLCALPWPVLVTMHAT